MTKNNIVEVVLFGTEVGKIGYDTDPEISLMLLRTFSHLLGTSISTGTNM